MDQMRDQKVIAP